MGVNPFDRTHLGYEGLFGPRTMFFHWTPADQGGGLIERLNVPVLNRQRVSGVRVERVTVLVVLIGFAWVCWRLIRVLLADLKMGKGRGEKEKKER